jgi:hypothetical protein
MTACATCTPFKPNSLARLRDRARKVNIWGFDFTLGECFDVFVTFFILIDRLKRLECLRQHLLGGIASCEWIFEDQTRGQATPTLTLIRREAPQITYHCNLCTSEISAPGALFAFTKRVSSLRTTMILTNVRPQTLPRPSIRPINQSVNQTFHFNQSINQSINQSVAP